MVVAYHRPPFFPAMPSALSSLAMPVMLTQSPCSWRMQVPALLCMAEQVPQRAHLPAPTTLGRDSIRI